MKRVFGLLVSMFVVGVLVVPFAEATSTPFPEPSLIKYRVVSIDLATGVITRGAPIYDTFEAAQWWADTWNWLFRGRRYWVEAVDMFTAKMVPIPVAPMPAAPAPIPFPPLPL
ncbi:MAG: hypothetical protein U1B30_08625 [Pseudomonadota bacterium]|nr:hypothetical protein [Pseudomonadota bacterium]